MEPDNPPVSVWLRRMMVVGFVAVLGAVGLAGLGCGGFFWAQPTSYHIARSRPIGASPSVVRAVLTDMQRLAAIAHFGPDDPAVTVTTSREGGPGGWIESRGPGGVSRLTVVAVSDAAVTFRSSNDGSAGAEVRFELHEVPTGTEVTVSVTHEIHGVARALWPFIGLEGRLAPGLDRTLVDLETSSRIP